MKTWPARCAKIEGSSLNFYDEPGMPEVQKRGSSIVNLSGVTVECGEEEFSVSWQRVWFKITLYRKGTRTAFQTWMMQAIRALLSRLWRNEIVSPRRCQISALEGYGRTTALERLGLLRWISCLAALRHLPHHHR